LPRRDITSGPHGDELGGKNVNLDTKLWTTQKLRSAPADARKSGALKFHIKMSILSVKIFDP
jgi:hypothetical protein